MVALQRLGVSASVRNGLDAVVPRSEQVKLLRLGMGMPKFKKILFK
jgi:hypothetical protein